MPELHRRRGTGGSNLLPSTGESILKFTSHLPWAAATSIAAMAGTAGSSPLIVAVGLVFGVGCAKAADVPAIADIVDQAYRHFPTTED